MSNTKSVLCIYCGKHTSCESCPPFDRNILGWHLHNGIVVVTTPLCINGKCCAPPKPQVCRLCPFRPEAKCICCGSWMCYVHMRPCRDRPGNDELDYMLLCVGCEKYRSKVEIKHKMQNARWFIKTTIARYQKAQIKKYRYLISSTLNRYDMATPLLIDRLVRNQIEIRHFNPANFDT